MYWHICTCVWLHEWIVLGAMPQRQVNWHIVGNTSTSSVLWTGQHNDALSCMDLWVIRYWPRLFQYIDSITESSQPCMRNTCVWASYDDRRYWTSVLDQQSCPESCLCRICWCERKDWQSRHKRRDMQIVLTQLGYRRTHIRFVYTKTQTVWGDRVGGMCPLLESEASLTALQRTHWY